MTDIRTDDIHPQDRQISLQPGAIFRLRSGNGYRFVQSADPNTGLADVDALVRERDAAIDQLVATQERSNAYLQLYRAVLANGPDGFLLGEVVKDDRGVPFDVKVLAVNKAFHQQTGISAKAVTGRTLSEAGVRGDASWLQIWERLVDGGNVMGPLQMSGGRWLDLEVFRLGGDVFGAHIRDVTTQKQAESRTAATLEQFRLIAEFGSDLAFQTDPDGTIQWVSHSSLLILGREPADLVGESSRELIHPDDVKTATAALSEGRPCHIRLCHADGSYRWLRFVFRSIVDPVDGAQIRIGSGQNIDAEYRMRGEVEAGKTRMADTVASLLDPYIVLEVVRDASGSEDYVIVELNEPAADRIGRTRSELIGQRTLKLFPSAAENLLPLFQATMATGEPLILDDAVMSLNQDDLVSGDYRADIRISKCGDGVAVTWRDASARHAAQSSLRRSEEMARLALDSAPFGTALLTVDGTIESANPALSQLLGRDAASLAGRNLRDLLGPGEAGALGQAVASLQSTGSVTTDQHLITGSGRLVPVRVTIASLMPSDATPRLVCHIIAVPSAGPGGR